MAEIEDLIKRSTDTRGIVLHKAIALEKLIDRFLLSYFAVDNHKRQWQFVELILDRLNFDGKIAIVEQILKWRFDKLEYKKAPSKLISALREIKDTRNNFAHYMVFTAYTKTEDIPKDFSLVEFRNAVKEKPFTKNDMQVFETRINLCIPKLKEWILEVDESGWLS